MNNGIKPTRLWHLTGKKYFRKLILDRECSRPPHNQRNIKDLLQVAGIALASGIGILASYGMLSPPKKVATVMKCDTSRAKKSCKPPKEPCSSTPEKPMKSCTSEDK